MSVLHASRPALAIIVAICLTSCGILTRSATPALTQAPAAVASLPTAPDSYLGVFEPTSPKSYSGVTAFASASGRHPDIAMYYSGWGEPFRVAFAVTARANGAVPLVQVNPAGPSLAAIAAGKYDAYLRSYATAVRIYRYSVIIGFGHEMNGQWYPWGRGHVAPSVFVAAWRHIVDMFRAQGARNVTWLWTVNIVRHKGKLVPLAPWWPGNSYVTWVGIDGYYTHSTDTFSGLFGATIASVRGFTKRPILLAETAVGQSAGVAKIADLFAGIKQFGLLGFVWFDMTQHGSLYFQDWRLESNPAALAAFRKSVASMRKG
jgi:mannan endo-1,4-beta-mannosidase